MIENLLYAFILVLSLALAAIAFFAFRRSGSRKVLLVTFALLLFVAKGLLFSVQLFTGSLSTDSLWIASGLLDIGILVAIFLAVLKR
jgi:hypothetical protein